MLIIGPTMIILFFILAFIVWIKFMTKEKPVKVIKEEQLYNREKENLTKKDQREPVQRQKTEVRNKNNKEEENKDSGIV